MNKQEYLLVKLMEECAEVSKACSKALRFGLDNHAPSSLVTNREELQQEVLDIVAVLAVIEDEGIIKVSEPTDEQMSKPIKKLYHYMKLSKELGTLTDEDTIYS